MSSLRHKIEAVLFAVGKEISVEKIASLTNCEVSEIESELLKLQSDYSEKDNSLHIIKRDDGMWKLTVKDEFVPLVSSIVESTEMDARLMQTLAVIAWKYPVVQSEIVKLRGLAAYEHMRELVEQGFIVKERYGRTYRVRLTKKFFQYFDLPSEEAKKAFLANIPEDVLEDAEDLDKEIDEVERLTEQHKQDSAARNEIEAAMQAATGVYETEIESDGFEEQELESEDLDLPESNDQEADFVQKNQE